MNTPLRPLSAYSLRLLIKHKCPTVAFNTESLDEKIYAAGMWHFIHSAGIDQLERMDDDQFKASLLAHGHSLSPQILEPVIALMKKELGQMDETTVEVESDEIANFPTTATSQTTSTH